MASDETTQALRSPDYLRRYFEATGREYVTGRNIKCPNAGAHKQGDANPSAKIYEDANGAHVKCFGCGFQGDIFALWQLDNGGTFAKAKAKLCAMFGIESPRLYLSKTRGGFAKIGAAVATPSRGAAHPAAKPSAATVQDEKPDAATQQYITTCAIAYQAGEGGEIGRAYMNGRGISDETARRFGVGYDAKRNAVIIPYGCGYLIRFIKPLKRKSGGEIKAMFEPAKRTRALFNGGAIARAAKSSTPVFIVEGEIDALSISEVGGVAVSCGGTGGASKIVETVKKIGSGIYIPCTDRDEAGEKAQAKLETELSDIVGAAVFKNAPRLLMPDRSDGTHPKDANEALQENRQSFTARVAEIVRQAKEQNAPYFTFADVPEMPPEEQNPRALFKGGYLRKGGGIIAASVAGAGKSTFSIQCALHWVMGKPCFGIAPVRELRTAIIQAEDDMEELAMFKANMRKGLNAEGWTDEQIRQAQSRLIFRKDFLGKTGEDFAECLKAMQRAEHFDLVIVNPLNSYFEGDVSLNADATAFFRKMIDPVIKAKDTECGILFIHHSGKPPKGKDAALFGKGAFAQYSMQGAAELNNWARAVLVLYPFENNTEFWTLTAAKRHKPLGWTDADGKPTKDFVIAYSSDYVYWRTPSAEEIAEARSSTQTTATPKQEEETPSAAALRFAKYICDNYPDGISLTLARQIARDVVKRKNSETVMGWLTHNPMQYGLKIEPRTDTGKDGRRRTAKYLLPKGDALPLDAATGQPHEQAAQTIDEIISDRDAAADISQDEPDGADNEG